jgi:hypothetical protein
VIHPSKLHAAFLVTHNWIAILIIGLILLMPVYIPMLAQADGTMFPVTTNMSIVPPVVTADGGGLNFRFGYTKARQCEYIGIEAKYRGVHADFFPLPGQPPPGTRLVGTQLSQMFHLDAPDLDGLDIWTIHRCSPFWLTVTHIYGAQ